MFNDFISNLISSLQNIDKNKSDIKILRKFILNKINTNGTIYIVAVGPNATMIKELIESFSYLFKIKENKFVLVSVKEEYESQLGWKHFENNKTIGVISAIEKNVSSKDIVIGLSATGKTNYVNHFLKESDILGAETFLITTSDFENKKEYIKHNIRLELFKKEIYGLYIGNHTTILKVILEAIILSVFEELGQIIDGNIVTTKIWTNKLFDVSYEVVGRLGILITRDKFKALIDLTNGELSLIIIIKKLHVNLEKAKIIAEENNYDFRKILK